MRKLVDKPVKVTKKAIKGKRRRRRRQKIRMVAMNVFHLLGQFLASPWAIIAGITANVFLLVVLLGHVERVLSTVADVQMVIVRPWPGCGSTAKAHHD